MTLTVQFYTLLAMVIMGTIFGASLDVYQRFLQREARKRWLVFINDILFWVIQGFCIFYILFLVNHGELRFYLLLALLLGFSAYQALLKNSFLKMLEFCIRMIKAVSLFIKRTFMLLIFRPIKWIILLVLSFILFIFRLVAGLVKIAGKMLLWILKTLSYPFIWIGKGLFLFLPKSARKSILKWSQSIAGFFKRIQKYILKGYKLLVTFIQRKK